MEAGRATATEIADTTGVTYANVSKLLRRKTDDFVKVGKEGKNVYYGLKSVGQ